MMRKKTILIYGRSISRNQSLIMNFENKCKVWVVDTLLNMVNFAATHLPDLILFELSKGSRNEVRTLKALRLLFPEVIILVIMDNQSTKELAKILKYGATDIFPRPFDPQLLVERTEALLKRRKHGA